MMFNQCELVQIIPAVTAILMTGATDLRGNILMYSGQTLAIGIATALFAFLTYEPGLYGIAVGIVLAKGIAVPAFLGHIADRIKTRSDSGTVIAPPLAMHLSIVLLGLSGLLAMGLPIPAHDAGGWIGATAGVSLVFSGMILMLTRKAALSQIVGFLVLENGIYLFALTQTHGMPMLVEMGVLLDVLVGVMIAGLLVFRIQHSFEHIDVTQLSQLKE